LQTRLNELADLWQFDQDAFHHRRIEGTVFFHPALQIRFAKPINLYFLKQFAVVQILLVHAIPQKLVIVVVILGQQGIVGEMENMNGVDTRRIFGVRIHNLVDSPVFLDFLTQLCGIS